MDEMALFVLTADQVSALMSSDDMKQFAAHPTASGFMYDVDTLRVPQQYAAEVQAAIDKMNTQRSTKTSR